MIDTDLTYANSSSAKAKLERYEITLLLLADLLLTKEPSGDLNALCHKMIIEAIGDMTVAHRDRLEWKVAKMLIEIEDEA